MILLNGLKKKSAPIEWKESHIPFAIHSWPKHYICPWDELLRKGDSPNLFLIDGRFRVCSFLTSLMMSKRGTVILFHDYYNRPDYHIIEQYLMRFWI